jgi:hypothetical protein
MAFNLEIAENSASARQSPNPMVAREGRREIIDSILHGRA